MTEPMMPGEQSVECRHRRKEDVTAFEDEYYVYMCRDCGAEIKGKPRPRSAKIGEG